MCCANVYTSHRIRIVQNLLCIVNSCIVENEPPFIDGDEVIHVEVNKTTRIRFNASDDKSYTYQVLQQPSAGFVFNNLSGEATWTPTDTNVTSIR